MCFFVGLIAESQPALDKDRISTTLSLNWARVSRISSSSVFSCQNLQTPDPCRGPETLNSSLICIFVEHGKTNRPTVIVLYHLVSSCIIVYHLNIYIIIYIYYLLNYSKLYQSGSSASHPHRKAQVGLVHRH